MEPEVKVISLTTERIAEPTSPDESTAGGDGW